MCILFVAVSENPEQDGYQLIIANNRDEFFDRPTKTAGFWEDHPDCISGLDQEPGREGGTWLAMSKQGRIGILLNILSHGGKDVTSKRGRGFLVTNFVTSSVPPEPYLQALHTNATDYNPFNLVLINKHSSSSWSVHYYSNADSSDVTEIKQGVFGMSNSVFSRPWRKVERGVELMTSHVEQYRTSHNTEALTHDLIQMLNDDTQCMPDPGLVSQGKHLSPGWQAARSAICVCPVEGVRYGTRVNTVIVVEASGRCVYTERAMREPVATDQPHWDTGREPVATDQPHWDTDTHTFHINNNGEPGLQTSHI